MAIRYPPLPSDRRVGGPSRLLPIVEVAEEPAIIPLDSSSSSGSGTLALTAPSITGPGIVTEYAGASANPHVIPLTGKTTGRDLFAFFIVAATPTLPSPWVEVASGTNTPGQYLTKVWRLPAASNTSGVTDLTIALNGARPLAAIVWQDDVDVGSIYVGIDDRPPLNQNPQVHGTGLHTFSARDQTFALYSVLVDGGGAPNFSTLDYTAYDQSYTDFGDSGNAGGNVPDACRVWIASNPDEAMSSNGVTATANQTGIGQPQVGVTGMLAYDAVAAPVSFPTTGVLDDFNRADEDPLSGGGQWTIPAVPGTTDLAVVSNKLVNAADSSWASAYRNSSTYGPNCEVFCTKGNDLGAVELLARLQATGTTGVDGYLLDVNASDVWSIWRIDNNAQTQVGATATQAVTTGDGIGFELVGSTLKGYYRAGAGAWVEVLSRTDATYSAAGHIGAIIQLTAQVDDFGGGTVGAGAAAPVVVPLDASTSSGSASLALETPTPAAILPLTASPAVATGTLALSAPARLPLAVSLSTATGTLALVGVPRLSLTGAALASASLSLLTRAIVAGSSTSVATATLVLTTGTAAPAVLPLLASPAVATASLGLRAPPTLALASSPASATASLSLRAQATLSMAPSPAVASASMVLLAPAPLPTAPSTATATATLVLTTGAAAPAVIPLVASPATATGTLGLRAPPALALAAPATATATLSLRAPAALTLAASAIGSASLSLTTGVAAPAVLPLTASSATATGTLNLFAPASLLLAPSAAQATASLAVFVPGIAFIAISGAATATGSMALLAPTRVSPAPSSAVATGLLALTANANLTLSASTAISTAALSLITRGNLTLSATAQATASLTLLTRANLILSASGQADGVLTLLTPTVTPATLLLAPSSALGSGLLALRATPVLVLASSAQASGSLVVISTSVLEKYGRLYLEVSEQKLGLTTIITEGQLHLLVSDPGVPKSMIASIDERFSTVVVDERPMSVQVTEVLGMKANIDIPLDSKVEVSE